MAIDTPHQMYFVDVLDPNQWDLDQLKSLSTKVIEVVCKGHMHSTNACLCVILHWAPNFYPNPIALWYESKTKNVHQKLQMLISAFVSNDQQMH
jgi:hypothetical protein